MKTLQAGAGGILIEVDSLAEAMDLYVQARAVEARDAEPLATEIVPAARTVLFDGVTAAGRRWLAEVAVRRAEAGADPGVRAEVAGDVDTSVVTVPIRYDGEDLEETAHLLGRPVEDLIAAHLATTFTVAFCGFAPGFAYCVGMDLEVPRLASPRARVAAGAVGLAGPFTGIYPHPSPGGWRIIGHTDLPVWDPTAPEPALLSPGRRLRFEVR